jgi:nucleoside-diphosphate-sugar epimerase
VHPWPKSVASLPLTVFHVAAIIRPSERYYCFYDRCARVNVGGTANCIAAARAAGADVFSYTCSSTAAALPTKYWNAPWRRWPTDYSQFLGEKDFYAPLRPHNQFVSNYSMTKAVAERLVCDANDVPSDPLRPGGFRTGSIRPGNIVYGHKDDLAVGPTLPLEVVPTYCAAWVGTWVHVSNIALAHLQHEAALLGPHAQKVGGRPYQIGDPGPPVAFEDFYTIARTLSITPFSILYPPPILMLIAAHLIELYCVALAYLPLVGRILKEPPHLVHMLQPSSLNSSVHFLMDDSAARLPPEKGGLGYEGACQTLEGLCMQMADWNRDHQDLNTTSKETGKIGLMGPILSKA